MQCLEIEIYLNNALSRDQNFTSSIILHCKSLVVTTKYLPQIQIISDIGINYSKLNMYSHSSSIASSWFATRLILKELQVKQYYLLEKLCNSEKY